MISVLFIGDIVGRPGREAIESTLPDLIKKTKADLVIANAENAAHGTGITIKTAKQLLGAGIHCLTSGDHAYDRKETPSVYEQDLPVIRPANFPEGAPGKGAITIAVGSHQVTILNLVGRVFMHNDYDDPFRKLDEMLQGVNSTVILDFHAEATSEKVAMGWYSDGKVAAMLGTHTHVQTSDERVLPRGAAFISDVGMTGPQDGVIGVNRDIIVRKFLTQMPEAHEIEERGNILLNAVHITIDPKTQQAKSIERIAEVVPR